LIRDLPKGGRIAEVGSQEGKFAEFLLHAAEPIELHIFELNAKLIRTRGVLLRDRRVVLHEGDSSSNLSVMPDHYFDWIYLDANHTWEGVLKDVNQAQRKVKFDGFLVFNDYTMWDYLAMMPYGVVQNVNDLCREAGFEMTHFAFSSWGYHDVGIARRKATSDS
jgi:methyltransferase family protein